MTVVALTHAATWLNDLVAKIWCSVLANTEIGFSISNVIFGEFWTESKQIRISEIYSEIKLSQSDINSEIGKKNISENRKSFGNREKISPNAPKCSEISHSEK